MDNEQDDPNQRNMDMMVILSSVQIVITTIYLIWTSKS